jgi:hypothetical protein
LFAPERYGLGEHHLQQLRALQTPSDTSIAGLQVKGKSSAASFVGNDRSKLLSIGNIWLCKIKFLEVVCKPLSFIAPAVDIPGQAGFAP